MSRPPVTVRIERLAHGGEGVGTLPSGKKIFVAGTAPGDLALVDVTQEKAQHARGRAAAIVEPGSARVAPRCRHAARCGGCQLQQVAPATQASAKEAAFYESLARLGGVHREAIPDARMLVPSPAAFGYRTRCRLRVEGVRIGFCGWRSRDVVDLEECPVLVPPLERLVLEVAAVLRARRAPGLTDVHLCVGDGARGAAALLAPHPGALEPLAQHLLATVPALQGIVIPQDPQPTIRFGEPVLATAAPGAPGAWLLVQPESFAQANAAAGEVLVRLAVDLLAPAAGDPTLELYAGAGTFTFALAARGARVTAIEEAGPTIELLGRAAAAASVGPTLEIIEADAVRACHRLAAEGRSFELALMDPPRQGAKELPAALAALGPRRIAYVSCDPATLARDVKALAGLGYRVRAAAPVDMFPQTYHVEGVVLLDRTV